MLPSIDAVHEAASFQGKTTVAAATAMRLETQKLNHVIDVLHVLLCVHSGINKHALPLKLFIKLASLGTNNCKFLLQHVLSQVKKVLFQLNSKLHMCCLAQDCGCEHAVAAQAQ